MKRFKYIFRRMGKNMADQNECKFDLTRLAPELQVKVFEALPSPGAAADFALTCRGLNSLYGTYKTQILARIRDNMIAPFYEYYAFHARLHIPESDIKHPPPGGWPSITRQRLSKSGKLKSEFVLDVLRHLPYIRQDHTDLPLYIDYMTSVIDYTVKGRPDLPAIAARFRHDPDYARRFRSPEARHKVPVAKAHADGTGGADIILDTSRGEVYEEPLRLAGGGGGGLRLSVREYFARKMDACRDLRIVFVPGDYAFADGQCPDENETDEGPPYDGAVMERMGEPVCPSQSFALDVEIDRDWVCHLYRKFGWPGRGWNKEEGLGAISDYRARRNADYEVWTDEQRLKREETLRRLGPVVGVLHCF